MRALWLEKQRLSFKESVEDPTPGRGEALIRMDMAGICSTDLELTRGYYPFTGILGHEFVGEVVAAPDAPVWVSKRVVGEINIACGKCHMCNAGYTRHCENRKTLGIHDYQGVFADYLKLPIENLHQVPDGIANEVAVFTEPLAAALEILDQTEIKASNRVLVLGAGRLGVLVAAILRESGCALDVLVRHEKQRVLLGKLNINTITEPELGTQRYDVVVEATGSPAGFYMASRYVQPRGRIVLKSTYKGKAEIDISKLVVDEITLIGSRCGSFIPAIEYLEQDKLDPRLLIDAVYHLDQGNEAFNLASETGVLKVLLIP